MACRNKKKRKRKKRTRTNLVELIDSFSISLVAGQFKTLNVNLGTYKRCHLLMKNESHELDDE